MTRTVPFDLAGQGDQALHSRQEVPWKARKYRRRNRIEIMCRHSLRQVTQGLPLNRNPHVLAVTGMSLILAA